jgi:hypothetical protein
MVEGTANDNEVALIDGQKPVLNSTLGCSRTQVEDLEVAMTIHAHILATISCEEQDIDGTRFIKGPFVDSLSVDLRFYEAEVILSGDFGNVGVKGFCS